MAAIPAVGLRDRDRHITGGEPPRCHHAIVGHETHEVRAGERAQHELIRHKIIQLGPILAINQSLPVFPRGGEFLPLRFGQGHGLDCFELIVLLHDRDELPKFHCSAPLSADQMATGSPYIPGSPEPDRRIPLLLRDPRTIAKPRRSCLDCHRAIWTEPRFATNRCSLTEVGVNDVSPCCWEWRLFPREIDAALIHGPEIFCRRMRPRPCLDILERTSPGSPRLQALRCINQNVFILANSSGRLSRRPGSPVPDTRRLPHAAETGRCPTSVC